MRIITVTFHRAENYGAVLQCYALQKVLLNMGHDAKVLDLGEERKMYLPVFENVRYIHRRMIFDLQRWKDRRVLEYRRKRFHDFIDQNLILTEHFETMQELYANVPDADCYITGSDQVWNPEMYPKLVELYRLDFVGQNQKKYSYAASFGKYVPEYNSQIWNSLQSYQMISVREKSALHMLNQHGLKARIDIDPVFLLDKSDWDRVSSDVRAQYKLPDRYILVFELIPRNDMGDVVNAIKALYEMPQTVVVSLSDKVNYFGDICIRDAGPGELLGLIRNACAVASTSFHGAMLSLIMEREIYAMPAVAKERFLNIFNELHLGKRVITEFNTELDNGRINYNLVRPMLQEMKNNAMHYLRQITGDELRGETI